jgi:HNH endonuclease
MSSEPISPEARRQILERARGCCEYCLCQRRFSPAPFSIEHIVPRSRGGSSEPTNLALACQGCNNYKFTHVTAIDPVRMEEVPLFNPRTDTWCEHFTWAEDFTELIGLTARGRGTIWRLRLNRPEIVALRRILVAAQVHPPAYPYVRLNP